MADETVKLQRAYMIGKASRTVEDALPPDKRYAYKVVKEEMDRLRALLADAGVDDGWQEFFDWTPRPINR